MGLSARTKSIAIVSVVTACISVAALGFLVDRIFRVNRAIGELSQSIEAESQRDSQLRSLQTLLQDLGAEEAALNRRFIDPEGVVTFIELLEDLAVDAQGTVEVVSVGIEPEEDASPHEWLRMALRFDGTWQELFHFVVLLESAPYAVKLDQVSLSQSEDEETAGVWEGAFVIRAAKLKSGVTTQQP